MDLEGHNTCIVFTVGLYKPGMLRNVHCNNYFRFLQQKVDTDFCLKIGGKRFSNENFFYHAYSLGKSPITYIKGLTDLSNVIIEI